MKYVACYCRVSTEEQVKFGFSIQAQKDALEKYCKEKQYKYEFYIDEGISASSMKKRKALNEMISKANVYDMILFTKLDRLSRNVLDANNINKILTENNCTMKAIDEDDIDTSTADGTFMFNLKVSLAQREIEKTSERIKFVFQNKREKGEITSGTRKYGWNIVNKKFIPNEEEVKNLNELYNYAISVNGVRSKIYKDFFIHHFPGKGIDAMNNYLTDTAYIGKYKLYRKDVYLDNYIPAIIDEELFFKVQSLFKKCPRSGPSISDKVSLFTGIAICSICNRRMSKKLDYRVKSKLIRYCCDNTNRYKVGGKEKKCTNNITVREDYIEKYLLENIKEAAQNYIIENKVVSQKKPKTDNSSKIKEIKNKINRLKDLYIDDLIDKETYKKDYTKYNNLLDELIIKDCVPKQKDLTNINKLINMDIERLYNQLSIEEKRQFWLTIINKIYIKNGLVEKIDFN